MSNREIYVCGKTDNFVTEVSTENGSQSSQTWH